VSTTQKTPATQAQALANFDNVWGQVVQACGNPQYGSAGQRCISDRQQGACTIRDAKAQCWNWFIGYRDPIANDATVTVASPLLTVPASVGLVSAGIDPTLLIIGGGALALVLILSM
jgi:hypothetical protein